MTEKIIQCLICKKPAVEKFRPFCSSRCSSIDLGKWLTEGYRLKTEEIAEESESLPNAETGQEGE